MQVGYKKIMILYFSFQKLKIQILYLMQDTLWRELRPNYLTCGMETLNRQVSELKIVYCHCPS